MLTKKKVKSGKITIKEHGEMLSFATDTFQSLNERAGFISQEIARMALLEKLEKEGDKSSDDSDIMGGKFKVSLKFDQKTFGGRKPLSWIFEIETFTTVGFNIELVGGQPEECPCPDCVKEALTE
jgi:hypothetical protein